MWYVASNAQNLHTFNCSISAQILIGATVCQGKISKNGVVDMYSERCLSRLSLYSSKNRCVFLHEVLVSYCVSLLSPSLFSSPIILLTHIFLLFVHLSLSSSLSLSLFISCSLPPSVHLVRLSSGNHIEQFLRGRKWEIGFQPNDAT